MNDYPHVEKYSAGNRRLKRYIYQSIMTIHIHTGHHVPASASPLYQVTTIAFPVIGLPLRILFT